MKHRLIMAEIEAILRAIPGLRVQRDRRQPTNDEGLRDAGPLAILYSGERETVELGNASALTWARRWELKPIITVLIAGLEQDAMREALEDIEAAFITAMDASDKLQEGVLLAPGSVPIVQVRHRHPDESDITGMEIFLNLQYDR